MPRRGKGAVSRRRALPLLALLGALGLVGTLWPREGEDVVEVARGDLILTVEVEGTLRAVDAHLIGPPGVRDVWNYQISFLAPEGEDVPEGAPVLTFDASELEKLLLDLRAASESADKEIEKKELDVLVRRRADALRLAEAAAKLEKKTLQLDRPSGVSAAIVTKELELDRELASREVAYLDERRRALDEADETDLRNLIEQRDRSRSRVRELEESIARMSLLAPRDGTVVHVADRSGQKKRVGDSVWRQEKVLAVPDLRQMLAEGHVDEFDAGKVAEGQSVELRLDAYPEIAYTGRIASVGKTIQAVSWNSPIRGLEVEIDLEETDTTRMRPEMRFRGRVETGRVEGAILVPLRALDRVDGRPAVRRLARGLSGETSVPVRLGRANEEFAEVLEGLAEGDRLRVPAGEPTGGDR
jgi:multidrug efflux pump subunit AcrA (membrane-fusion protein)